MKDKPASRKVGQIACAAESGGDPDNMIVALCDDGTVWQLWASNMNKPDAWRRMPDIPRDNPRSWEGRRWQQKE